MEKKYKVSIIIPVYNVHKYIGRCLTSVFMQECPEVDIECILVDDCSPDDSMKIAARMIGGYYNRGGKIHFETIRHSENSGHCVARNAAVRIATGDYYLFVDSDDYLEPDAVKYLIEELDSVGDHVEVVMANALSNRNNRLLSRIPKKRYLDNSNKEALYMLLNRILFNTSWNKLVKANVFTEYGLYFPEGIINEDLLWSYLLLLHARNVLLLPRVTYVYENSNQQSITNTNTYGKYLKFIRSRLFICNQIFSNPPRPMVPDYYGYLFCILHRTKDIYEHLDDASGTDAERREIRQLKHRLLRSTWRYPLLCCLILTLYKPFYYVVKIKAFRRYFNHIIRIVVAASQKYHL